LEEQQQQQQQPPDAPDQGQGGLSSEALISCVQDALGSKGLLEPGQAPCLRWRVRKMLAEGGMQGMCLLYRSKKTQVGFVSIRLPVWVRATFCV
jgi:hypothetical protein